MSSSNGSRLCFLGIIRVFLKQEQNSENNTQKRGMGEQMD